MRRVCSLIVRCGCCLSRVQIAAETGSGKTGAFCIPILQTIYEAIRGVADVTGTESKADGKSSGSSSSSSSSAGGSDKALSGAKLNVIMNPADRDSIFAISPDGLTCQVFRFFCEPRLNADALSIARADSSSKRLGRGSSEHR